MSHLDVARGRRSNQHNSFLFEIANKHKFRLIFGMLSSFTRSPTCLVYLLSNNRNHNEEIKYCDTQRKCTQQCLCRAKMTNTTPKIYLLFQTKKKANRKSAEVIIWLNNIALWAKTSTAKRNWKLCCLKNILKKCDKHGDRMELPPSFGWKNKQR